MLGGESGHFHDSKGYPRFGDSYIGILRGERGSFSSQEEKCDLQQSCDAGLLAVIGENLELRLSSEGCGNGRGRKVCYDSVGCGVVEDIVRFRELRKGQHNIVLFYNLLSHEGFLMIVLLYSFIHHHLPRLPFKILNPPSKSQTPPTDSNTSPLPPSQPPSNHPSGKPQKTESKRIHESRPRTPTWNKTSHDQVSLCHTDRTLIGLGI